MDLVAGVKRVVVVMDHASKSGEPKLLRECALPLTGARVVDMVITNLAVFEISRGASMRLIELASGVSLDEVRAKTEAKFDVAL